MKSIVEIILQTLGMLYLVHGFLKWVDYRARAAERKAYSCYKKPPAKSVRPDKPTVSPPARPGQIIYLYPGERILN